MYARRLSHNLVPAASPNLKCLLPENCCENIIANYRLTLKRQFSECRDMKDLRSKFETVFSKAKLYRRMLLSKQSPEKTLKVWARQFEFVFAQRVQRGQQMFCLYSKWWEEKAFKEFVRKLRVSFVRNGKEFLMGAMGVSLYNWEEKRISDVEFQSHLDDLNYIEVLKEATMCMACALGEKSDTNTRICQCGTRGVTDKTYDDWVPFIEKDDLVVWRRPHGEGLFEYKVYGSYYDVTAEDFLNVQVDTDYRKQWDTTAVQLEVGEKDPDPDGNSDILYWEMQWPRLFVNRDYVFNRRYKVFVDTQTIVIINRTTEYSRFPKYPDKFRVEEYWSCMVIKPYETMNQAGIEFSLTYFDNPGVNIPSSVTTWVAKSAMPDYLARLRHASKNYRGYCLKQGTSKACEVYRKAEQERREEEERNKLEYCSNERLTTVMLTDIFGDIQRKANEKFFRKSEVLNSDTNNDDNDDLACNGNDPIGCNNDQGPQPGPSTSKKRLRNEDNWTVNKRKLLRNSDKEYFTKRGTRRVKERTHHHQSFWNLENFNLQNSYLYALVQKTSVNRKRPKDGSRAGKNISFKYFIKSREKTESVCKKYFLNTFNISDGKLYRCLSKRDVSQSKDKRGTTSSRKFDDSDVVAHIQSFPSYQSHYTRAKNPNRKYLNPGLTIRKMYDLYKQRCETEMTEPKKLKYYNKVFNTKFNLHFKTPHQDTCKTCDDLNLNIQGAENEDAKTKLEQQRELHQRKAASARGNLQSDSKKKISEAYIITFDLQKALAYPKLTTSVAYYKRNLYLYNLGIHCFNNNTGYMYVWDEVDGGRGSQDIASCLVKHIKVNAASQKHIIMYSDSCTGQNRNIKTSLSMLKLVQDPELSIDTIDHKFLISGHSYLPNDGQFGIIESASRRHGLIYGPDQWIDIIKNAKHKEPHFNVIQMNHKKFLSTAALESSITNRKKTTCGYEFNWLNIRWLRFERNHPLQFKFKETLNIYTPFYEVDIGRKKQGRPINNLHHIQQDPLYPTRRAITSAKKKDMFDLLPYIPPVYHAYYRNLPVDVPTRSCTSKAQERSSDDEITYD